MRLASLLPILVLLVAPLSCAVQTDGDPHSMGGIPAVGGKDKRIKDVGNPKNDGHKDQLTTGVVTAVSGAVVIAVDTFDETGNGKGTGTIYVQDLGSQEAYSGISLFAPSFTPGNLSVGPGDVLDLRGQYQENASISTAVFAPGSVLPQLSRPVATFRYEADVPAPVDIPVEDLADYAKGRRWLGMLVRVRNIILQADAVADMNGRVAVNLAAVPGAGTKCNSPFPRPASLTNALFDVAGMDLKAGKTLKSITGVVGFFCNLQLAPRSKADIQL